METNRSVGLSRISIGGRALYIFLGTQSKKLRAALGGFIQTNASPPHAVSATRVGWPIKCHTRRAAVQLNLLSWHRGLLNSCPRTEEGDNAFTAKHVCRLTRWYGLMWTWWVFRYPAVGLSPFLPYTCILLFVFFRLVRVLFLLSYLLSFRLISISESLIFVHLWDHASEKSG